MRPVTVLVYKDDLNPVVELDGSGGVVAQFVYSEHENVPSYIVKDGTTYRIISDHLGSPRLVVNTASGDVVQKISYDEWGNVRSDTNPGFQPFAFAGGVYDKDTQLLRFGARDYDPKIGRWTTKDPIIALDNGFNIYNYVNGNPINATDRTGLFNPTKGFSAIVNFGNSARLAISALNKAGVAGGALATGSGPIAVPSLLLGFWNLRSSAVAYGRGSLLWSQALQEKWEDASFKNICGILPFGEQYDDPDEPLPLDWWRNFFNDLRNQDLIRALFELGTLLG